MDAATNTLLADILAELQEQSELARKPYGEIVSSGLLFATDSTGWNEETTPARAANANAVKTVVHNIGLETPHDIWVYEGLALVAILPVGERWESYGGGTERIDVYTKPLSDDASQFLITTYLAPTE